MMATIETWSHIDGDLTYLFSTFLRTDVHAATAVYEKINGAQQRQRALLAAADSALPEWQRILLRTVLKVIEPSRSTRNTFAHGITGYSDELPGYVLIADPAVLTAANISRRQPTKHLPGGGKVIAPREPDPRGITVWSLDCVELAKRDAEICGRHVMSLAMAIGYGRNEQARRQLLNEPAVQERLKKSIEGASNFLRAQLLPPGDEPPAPGVWENWDASLGRDMTYWEDRDDII